MSKTTKVILIVAGIVLFLGFAAWLLVPRALLAFGNYTIVRDVGPAAEYFTEYGVLSEDVQTIDNGHIAIDIPVYYVQKDTDLEVGGIYYDPEKTKGIILMGADDMSDMNLLNEENLGEGLTDMQFSIGMEQLTEGFEALGNGLPDCAYHTYKCMKMLDKEDYSFWNLNQAAAFLVTGTLKNILMQYETTLVYETEEICGFVEYTQMEDGEYKVLLEIYRTDDLNTVSSVILSVKDLDAAYAVMNSARRCEEDLSK